MSQKLNNSKYDHLCFLSERFSILLLRPSGPRFTIPHRFSKTNLCLPQF